jgi:hypothetical protein
MVISIFPGAWRSMPAVGRNDEDLSFNEGAGEGPNVAKVKASLGAFER